jgi:hypothetical protein
VPALLRGEHQREGRIPGNVDMRDRVHLDGNGERHEILRLDTRSLATGLDASDL